MSQATQDNYGQPGDVPFDVPGEEYLEIPDAVAPADADRVYQDQTGFSEIPPGPNQELVILGFFGTPQELYVKANLNGQTVGYTVTKRTIKIGLASNPKASMLFDVQQPPADPTQLNAYWHGVPEGRKAPGWHAHTFRGLVGAAIAPWQVGQPMPRPAKFERNWVGRRFVATIDPPEPYIDNRSGQEKMGKARLNQRSFKPAPGQTPLVGMGQPQTQGQTQGMQGQPQAASGGGGAGYGPGAAQASQGQRPATGGQQARMGTQAPAAAATAPAPHTEWQM